MRYGIIAFVTFALAHIFIMKVIGKENFIVILGLIFWTVVLLFAASWLQKRLKK